MVKKYDEEVKEFGGCDNVIDTLAHKINKLEQQRDELLEALKNIIGMFGGQRREIIASKPYRSIRLSEEKISEYAELICDIEGTD